MKKYFLLIMVAALLLLVSCNPDGPGIFYKISVEPPLSSSSLSEKSVYKVVSDGTDTYVLAGGEIYKGPNWNKITAPASDSQAVSLATDGSKIYSVYAGETYSSMYELDGSTWISNTDIDDLDNSNDLSLIESGTNLLFICQETSIGNYIVWSYSDTNPLNQLNSSPINIPVISVAYDSSNYFIISSNTTTAAGTPEIYISNGSNLSWTANHGDFDTTQAIGGIVYDGLVNNLLYLSTKTGNIYSSPDGNTWTNVDTLENTELGHMVIFTGSGADFLLIGSDGGFYEMDLSIELIVTPTSSTIGETEYISVDLNKELVHSILTDGSLGFYIGTSNGLWYSDLNKLNLK